MLSQCRTEVRSHRAQVSKPIFCQWIGKNDLTAGLPGDKRGALGGKLGLNKDHLDSLFLSMIDQLLQLSRLGLFALDLDRELNQSISVRKVAPRRVEHHILLPLFVRTNGLHSGANSLARVVRKPSRLDPGESLRTDKNMTIDPCKNEVMKEVRKMKIGSEEW